VYNYEGVNMYNMSPSTERKTRPRKPVPEDDTDERITELEDRTDRTVVIESRLTKVEEEVDDIKSIIKVADAKMTTLLERSGETKRALWGTDGKIGMVGRLAQVEEIISDTKRLMWIILGVVVSLAIGGVWELLIKKP
jgi:hypothetical protein